MRRFTRLATPQYLTEINAKKQLQNWEVWSNRYAQNKIKKQSYQFSWIKEKQKINHLLLPSLTAQTQNHCAYCDAYPMKVSDETIDHFKPKGDGRFYHLAYQWENLYYCCADCQKAKWEQFDDDLLRPDAADFSFSRYFIVNYSTGEIDSNPAASPEDQHRASITIDIFDLKHKAQCTSRRHSVERFQSMPHADLEDFAYRFMFDE